MKAISLPLICVAIALLSACAPSSVDTSTSSDVWLRQLRDSQQMDAKAAYECQISPFAVDLVSAVDSTSEEIRNLRGLSRVAPDFAEGLPDDDNAYVALCIWRTPPGTQVKESYFALWTVDDGFYTSLIAGFD